MTVSLKKNSLFIRTLTQLQGQTYIQNNKFSPLPGFEPRFLALCSGILSTVPPTLTPGLSKNVPSYLIPLVPLYCRFGGTGERKKKGTFELGLK